MPRANPFKLDTLIAWLKKQPAGARYSYSEPCGCALARYFSAHGFSEVAVDPFKFEHSGGKRKLPPHFDVVSCEGKRTYGAALDRARALVRT